jgi:FkbM family methyltransferase
MKSVLGSTRFIKKVQEIRLRRFYKNLVKQNELFNPTFGIKGILMKRVSGILHIGAHIGQEASFYSSHGLPVIWIEASPDVFIKLQSNIRGFRKQTAVQALLGDVTDQVNFYMVPLDKGQSSSIYQLNPKFNLGDLTSVQETTLEQKKLDDVFKLKDLSSYNYWVIDVQGAELKVLKGATNSLQNCSYLELEVSNFENYTGQPLFGEVSAFLKTRGFFPVFDPPSNFHGNVLFIKDASSVLAP